MKRKLLIFSALISVLLAGFQFSIYAEEDPDFVEESVPIPNSIRLDAYFYDNYDLLPFIEADGRQIINTGLTVDQYTKYYLAFSDYSNPSNNAASYLFGSQGGFYSGLGTSESSGKFYYLQSTYVVDFNTNPYAYNIFELIDKNVYLNGNLVNTLTSNPSGEANLFLFSRNATAQYSSAYKLYSLRISDVNGFLRYYYPAKSKNGGVVGLYDAVTDTFVTTSLSVPFSSPVDDQVLNFQIIDFLTAGLIWIGDIFEFAVDTPIIMIFMAIGLAGAMFRWSRRIIHF